MKRAKQEGVEALKHRPPPGAQARLSEEQRAKLPELLAPGVPAHGLRGVVGCHRRSAAASIRDSFLDSPTQELLRPNALCTNLTPTCSRASPTSASPVLAAAPALPLALIHRSAWRNCLGSLRHGPTVSPSVVPSRRRRTPLRLRTAFRNPCSCAGFGPAKRRSSLPPTSWATPETLAAASASASRSSLPPWPTLPPRSAPSARGPAFWAACARPRR
jgi:hypothetical protein